MKYWTLKGATRSIVKTHINENKLFKKYQWSKFARLVHFFGEKPFLFFAILLFSYISILLFSENNYLENIKYIETGADSILGNLTVTLLASQAAILGILYPMVIGLISVSTSKSEIGKTLLNVYFEDTKIKIIGLSGLYFLFFLATQGLILDHVKDQTYFLISLLNVTWFTLNLLGTGIFLWVTRLYLNPSLQLERIKHYTANVSWPYEFSNRLKSLIWLTSIDPKMKMLPDVSKQNVSISLGHHFLKDGEPVYTKEFSQVYELSNVRFWLLRPILKSWANRESNNGDVEEYKRPTLSIPIMPNIPLSKDDEAGELVNIITLDNCLKRPKRLDDWWNLFIPFTFVFSKSKSHSVNHSVTETFSELANSVIEAMQLENVPEFEKRWFDLIKYHGFIIQLSKEMPDNEQRWPNLAEKLGDHYWGNSLNSEWVREYDSIFNFSMDRYSKSSLFIRYFAQASASLIFNTIKDAPVGIISSFMEITSHLQRHITSNWNMHVDENIAKEHNYERSRVLGLSLGSQHDMIYRKIVSGWESVLDKIMSFGEKEGAQDYEDAERNLSIVRNYLFDTIFMITRCVVTGDIEGARWILDSFTKFDEKKSYRLGRPRLHFSGYQKTVINNILVTKHTQFEQWKENYKNKRSYFPDTEIAVKGLLGYALSNLHDDVMLSFVLVYISWNYKSDQSDIKQSENNTSLQIIRDLIENNCKDSLGRHSGRKRFFQTPTEVFECYLRYFVSGGKYEDLTYRGQMDGFINQLEGFMRPDMISGRIYSSSRREDLPSNIGALIVVLLITMKDSSASEDNQLLKNGWQDNFQGNHSEGFGGFINSLITFVGDEKELACISVLYKNIMLKDIHESKVSRLKKLFKELLVQQTDDLKAKIINAPISDKRIMDVRHQIIRYQSAFRIRESLTSIMV